MDVWSEFGMGESKDDDHRESIGMTHPTLVYIKTGKGLF